jgi:hypothetical protein
MQRLQPAGRAAAAAERPVVQFEVAESENGPTLAGIVPPVVDDAAAGAWYAEGAINLAPLAPGTYLVRAIVLWDGAMVGRVSRSIIVDRGASQ